MAGALSGLIVLAACSFAVVFLGGCKRVAEHVGPGMLQSVVTADIQAAIEAYVESRVRQDGGYFRLIFGNKELRPKLVRVHTEYLSSLAPRLHFACVDLADVSGDVYDVDFFLAGERGQMTVTETTVHKLNGQPYYAWKQNTDGTWRRIPVDKASAEDLGVKRGTDKFEFVYRARLPKLTGLGRMWLPLASSDEYQKVEIVAMDAPGTRRFLEDKVHGNRLLFLELHPGDEGKAIEIKYRVERKEKAAYAGDPNEAQRFLEPEKLVPDSDEFKRIAEEVLKGKKGDLVSARALYDHVIDSMKYIKNGSGWGQGDAVYACDVRTGNCTDYHAYFIALARAAGIPARFAIGASIPSERNSGGIDGYHCWAEFYADGRWWPVDISEGDKYSALATYYFGHHPANRIELSRGRDLVVEPGPASGPINFLAYPLLEVGGEQLKAKTEFSFRRIEN